MGGAVLLQAVIWSRQRRFEDALSEVLHAQETYEKLGNPEYLEMSRVIQRKIEEEMKTLPPSGEPDSDGEISGIILRLTSVNPPFSPWCIVKLLGQHSS